MEPQTTDVCPICHEPVKPEWYFCPNCGTKLRQAPLSTSPMAQLGLYAFSIILPWILFIMVTKWQGITYLKSKNPQEKQIGIIACTLLVASTILTIWLAYVFTQQLIQSSLSSLNTDFNFANM
jgi:hypothetical protein